ncbi:MAG: hypothetical protein ACYC1U_01985 [Candidatus Aquicultorales bacterium]
MKAEEAPDHDEKYRDHSTEEDETAYFDEPADAPGPSVAAGGPGDHTHVDESAYFDEEPAEKPGEEGEGASCKGKLGKPGEEDRAPSPGVPNFWASTEMEDDEDWVPPTRNRPSSSPWQERGKLEEAE